MHCLLTCAGADYMESYQKIRIILMDQDDFYDKLPFTLTEDQTAPEYVIFGTGLQECLIAAYKSKSESKTGLIIDAEKTYGSSLKTVTLKEFHLLATQTTRQRMYSFLPEAGQAGRNQEYYDWCVGGNKHRGFNIDIEPNFFFAASLTCECLKDADMDKYMDFHLVNNILHLNDGKFRPVPLSKGKIFESKELSLLEKKTLLMSLHKLIKIYHRFMQLPEDQNSTKEFDKGFGDIEEELYVEFEQQLEQSFTPFLERLVKKNRKIMNYLTYIICNYQYNYDRPIPAFVRSLYTLRGFIQKFGKFIKSCGVYGEIPYLYVDNGIGDIPQAFSRIASIYGSTYILHPKITIDSIQQHEGRIHIATNLSPERPIITKEVYFGPNYLDLKPTQEQFDEELILRMLVLCEKNGKEDSCPSICFINELTSFDNPVYLFTFDSSTQSCPAGLIIYQFETILSSAEGAADKGQKLLELLASVQGEGFKESIKYSCPYLRTRRYPKEAKTHSSNEFRLNDTKGIDLDQHFNNFVSVVGEKQHYFKKENVVHEDEEEPYGGYETNYLLEKLNQIKLNETAQGKQVEKKDEEKQEQITNQDLPSEEPKEGQTSDKKEALEVIEDPPTVVTSQEVVEPTIKAEQQVKEVLEQGKEAVEQVKQ